MPQAPDHHRAPGRQDHRPELSIANGTSGAIRHLIGIKDVETTLSINKDADSEIFEIADIGFAWGLFVVLPELDRAAVSAAEANQREKKVMVAFGIRVASVT